MDLPEAQLMLSSHYNQGFFRRKVFVSIAWALVAANRGHPQANEMIARVGAPPKQAQEMSQKLISVIDNLRLSCQLDSEAGLKRLDELQNEEWK